MARNRMIKPEFWSSETLNSISLESNLFFIGLWNFADDYGVLLDNDRQLLGNIFPYRENISAEDIKKWKKELIEKQLLVPITIKKKNLLIIKSWFEHQKVPNPSKRSYLCNPSKDNIAQLIRKNLESN